MATTASVAGSDAVRAFLSGSPVGVFVGGRWRPTRNRIVFDTVDPGSGAVLAQVYDAGAEDVDDAVQAARRAFRESGWAQLTPAERGVYLHRLADLVDDNAGDIAQIESLDVGKPYPQACFDVGMFSRTLRYYTDLAVSVRYSEPIAVSRHEARTIRKPWGACAFILPWNFPFLLAGWNLSPALAAGNTVILKPAEDTSLSSLYLGRLVMQAGIPDGVVNVVTGHGETAGAALACHPGISRLAFTGSPEVGRLVGESCGRNLVPVKLELGGKGAAVVFEDVELDRTVDSLVAAVTFNAGQVCCTATRWIVHDSVYDEFVSKAVERLKAVRIGYWNDPQAQMGPVVSPKQKARVLGYLDRGVKEGAEMLLEGREAAVEGRQGFYVTPALLAGDPDNVACREEIFGPVSYMLRFRTEDEALELVNRSAYGLANSVWTSNLARANAVAEQMVAGNSWINAHNVFVHGVPYAGTKLSGMGGGVMGPGTLFDYLREQSVVRPV